MKSNLKKTLSVLAILVFILGCSKDKLTDELEVFKGRYKWEYSRYKEHIFSTTFKIRQASQSSYTAEVEFTDRGKIIFYINGDEIHKTGYSVKEKETSQDGNTIYLTIKPFNENSRQLDLNDNVNFTLMGDTLIVNDFPGASYDDSVPGTHFFMRN